MNRLSSPDRRNLSAPWIGTILVVVIFLIILGSAGPWDLRMGFIALAFGILILLAPPVVRLGRSTRLLSAGFLLLGLAPFLPVGIFGMPEWRREFTDLGVGTGGLVAIQWKAALEYHLSFVLLFLVGLWILGQRFSLATTRNLAFAFVLGVAVYALVSKGLEEHIPASQGNGNFGFLPNRNHSSNFLSIGFLCGLGAMFQSLRGKEHGRWVILLLANSVIVWAIMSWSISRSGIVLCLTGSLIWLGLLGRRYFGRDELKAFALVALLVSGIYGISEFRVKDRIEKTVEKFSGDDREDWGESNPVPQPSIAERFENLDLRVPIAKDTFQMIAAAPLTGVGAGQFRWVFPQYRQKTIVVNRSVALHPESSWLWLAAELGIPAALCILLLVGFLFWGAVGDIRAPAQRGRALRFGCLVAAAVVPLHGLFDVPAHRPSLYLASLLLFSLSRNPVESDSGASRPWRWPYLVLGVLLICGGVRLLGCSWFGWRSPHLIAAGEQLAKGRELYQMVSDQDHQLPLFEALALRVKIDEISAGAIGDAPLDGRLYRLSALALRPLQYESGKTARHFAIDRQLTPSSVDIPLLHAAASLQYDPEEVRKGWALALTRARQVDEESGKGPMTVGRVLRIISSAAEKNPQYRSLAEEMGAPLK
jgi:O-antigen ligase